MSTLLSKSTFIRSLQCKKSLYLYKNHYGLRDEISLERQYVFERGHTVGKLAQQLFPDGIDVGWESPKDYKKSVKLTQEQILNGANVIYEAAFTWNDVLVAADILVRTDAGWHIYEVKSSLSISETYLRDAALQLYVITKSGLKISGISLIHLNKGYVRNEALELTKLFQIEEVTSEAEKMMGEVTSGLIEARKTLMQNRIPIVNIGPQCDEPYTCDFKGFCGWNKIPRNSVFDFDELPENTKWRLFNDNIIKIEDIPADYPFTPIQKITWQSKLNNEVYINKPEISAILDKIQSPSTIMDIQVFRPGVPLNFGAHPYKQIPFGYGLMKMDSQQDVQEQELFITDAAFDFEEAFLEKFVADTDEIATFIVFDKKWELWALKKMTERFPHYKAQIEKRINVTVDLSEIFKYKHFYHPKMQDNLRTLPAVFGLETEADNSKIGSDSLAGTAFEHLYQDGDLLQAIEIRGMLQDYIKGNVLAVNLVYEGLRDVIGD